jgi:hypothetical protein
MKIPSPRRPLVLIVLLGLASTARADLTYSYVSNPSPISLQVGETFLLNVYLQETATDGDSPRFVGAGNGLFSQAVRVDFGASAASRVLASSDVVPNSSDFADTLAAGLIDPGAAQVNEQVLLSSIDPVAGTNVSPGVSRIFVGSFLFTAVEAGTAVVTFGDLNPDFDDVIAADGFVLDPVLQAGTVQFTVVDPAIVPEPASVVLMGSGLCAMACLLMHRGQSRPTA